MEIHRMISSYNYTPGSTSRIKYIVIHYVGALGGAKANCEYYGGGNRGASAHYYVDFDGSVWQSVEDKNIAWHCGASSYVHPECRNANSLGIEMCVRKRDTSHLNASDKDWYFEDATVKAAAQLVKMLMEKYGVEADHVIRHHDVTGKICPNPFVYNTGSHTWTEFKQLIGASSGQTSGGGSSPGGSTSGGSSSGGSTSGDSTSGGSASGGSSSGGQTSGRSEIIKAGQIHANNFCGANIAADGIRGSATKKAGVKVWQNAMNLDYGSGLSVDGIVGSRTLASMDGHTVRRGERQYMVTALEILLMLKGYDAGGVESPGIFGGGLEAAVRRYQKDAGLSVDGIAGRNTFISLAS